MDKSMCVGQSTQNKMFFCSEHQIYIVSLNQTKFDWKNYCSII